MNAIDVLEFVAAIAIAAGAWTGLKAAWRKLKERGGGDTEETPDLAEEPEEEPEPTVVDFLMQSVEAIFHEGEPPSLNVFATDDAEVAYVEAGGHAIYVWEAGPNAFVAFTTWEGDTLTPGAPWAPLQFVGFGELSNDQAWKLKHLIVDGLQKFGADENVDPARVAELPMGLTVAGLGLQKGFKDRLEQISYTMETLDNLPGRQEMYGQFATGVVEVLDAEG